MYVDDISDMTDPDKGSDELTVEIDGQDYTVEENVDFDGDGNNDTAVLSSDDGVMIAVADTDHDGIADVAVEYDENGNPVAGAQYDPTTGEWHAEDVDALPTPGGDGAGDSGQHDGYTAGKDDMTVDMPDGPDVSAGPATYDTDGDGENDTAVVTGTDGTTYMFTDVDGDGTADQAVVVDAEGDVTIASHVGEDEWEVVEEGHLNSDGTYETDSTAGAHSSGAWESEKK